MEEMPAVIKAADMPEEQINMAIKIAAEGKNKYGQLNLVAAFIKREFDRLYEPSWHCCVGDTFGSYITHETGNLIYFFLKEMAVLIWKAG
jgi:dynein light chain LC8-type